MTTCSIPFQFDLSPHSSGLPEDLWLAEAVHCREIVKEQWSVEDAELPADLGSLSITLRSSGLQGWSLYGHVSTIPVHLAVRRGRATASVAGPTQAACSEAVAALRKLLPEATEVEGRIQLTVWASGDRGPEAHDRSIDVPAWKDIAHNYSAATRTELDRLMRLESPSALAGHLILWHGLPGTGKTWALRALGYEWRSWCELHYVSEPEVFLGDASAYMLQVCLDKDRGDYDYDYQEGDDEEQDKWRLIVLEDAGEMLSVDAKERVGQALGRLLNLTDGLLGQGARVLVLITTNEELGHLHPAVQRPGRCAAVVSFDRLAPDEADSWLTRQGEAGELKARTLAELYGRLSGAAVPREERSVGFVLTH